MVLAGDFNVIRRLRTSIIRRAWSTTPCFAPPPGRVSVVWWDGGRTQCAPVFFKRAGSSTPLGL